MIDGITTPESPSQKTKHLEKTKPKIGLLRRALKGIIKPKWQEEYADYFSKIPSPEQEKTKELFNKLETFLKKTRIIDENGSYDYRYCSFPYKFEGITGIFRFYSARPENKPNYIEVTREYTGKKGKPAREEITINSEGKASYECNDPNKLVFKNTAEKTGDMPSESLFEGETPLVKHIAAVVNPLCEAIDKRPQPETKNISA